MGREAFPGFDPVQSNLIAAGIEVYASSGIGVEFGSPATLVDHSGKQLRIETPRGQVAARAAIITVPPSIIACEFLRFHPRLWEKLDAAHALPLGLADKVFRRVDEAAELPQGTRLFGAIDRAATGSYHLRPFGRLIIEGYFGGQFARELEEEGEGAFARFAIDQIALAGEPNCIPAGTLPSQIVGAFYLFIRRHPDQYDWRRVNASSIVMLAVIEQWCPSQIPGEQ